ncbi:hypothetical protein pdam_00008841 [Pocillopora damicornis]|uniref:Uncharacterized protein n=1 Tax=Pocillopora damicornis TaxID=46731 RepID=A0A3M6US79_POCDA|nr:hypothetical protein pdam_00008841 [Pocillopora damicornis]
MQYVMRHDCPCPHITMIILILAALLYRELSRTTAKNISPPKILRTTWTVPLIEGQYSYSYWKWCLWSLKGFVTSGRAEYEDFLPACNAVAWSLRAH